MAKNIDKIYPDNGEWATIDFTEIRKGGVSAREILKILKKIDD
jgi:hypothetical protein